MASGGRIDRSRPHLGPDGSGEQTFPGDSPTAVFVASGAMVARTSAAGRPRGVIRDGEVPGSILGFTGPAGDPAPACDVLVVGAGPAGLSAALTAARTGLRVTVADRASGPGGAMLTDAEVRWAQETVEELAGLGAELLFGTEVEQLSPGPEPGTPADGDPRGAGSDDDPGAGADPGGGVEVFVRHGAGRRNRIAAGRVVLATGAVERPALFPGNGTPGVMPAGAVRAFLLRYGVLAGEQVVLLAGDDDAYRVAGDLLAVGAAVALVDPRPDPDGAPAATYPGKSYDPVPTGSVLNESSVTGVVTGDAGGRGGVRVRAADGT
ncbi:NAD(P)/FAD-dependent oxidoreductase, partial [Nakamurella flavida]